MSVSAQRSAAQTQPLLSSPISISTCRSQEIRSHHRSCTPPPNLNQFPSHFSLYILLSPSSHSLNCIGSCNVTVRLLFIHRSELQGGGEVAMVIVVPIGRRCSWHERRFYSGRVVKVYAGSGGNGGVVGATEMCYCDATSAMIK
ncbi:Hypothetical predicted protein [Olea europaea subsp. europaea]|uniref:Uncharacterized protein n=1 Tax=Olea europaea subsp. europaea TaxID=158383 RepID=A0A8S0UNJ5_OLEEU|nr:Hypothetical predicted protein [Olea europaea subsp. europaea]